MGWACAAEGESPRGNLEGRRRAKDPRCLTSKATQLQNQVKGKTQPGLIREAKGNSTTTKKPGNKGLSRNRRN